MIKARTKNTRIHIQRRGRPRIENAIREPNGRISRAKNPPDRNPAKIALMARAKHSGLSLEEARDPRAESWLGRLSLASSEANGISQDQYDAASRFLEIRNDYLRAKGLPGAHYDSHTSFHDEKGHLEWVKKIENIYISMMHAIQEAQFDHPHENLYAALHYVLIDRLELPHLLGATRMLLNALNRHFVLSSKQENSTNKKRTW